jgi:hypothetical protein
MSLRTSYLHWITILRILRMITLVSFSYLYQGYSTSIFSDTVINLKIFKKQLLLYSQTLLN